MTDQWMFLFNLVTEPKETWEAWVESFDVELSPDSTANNPIWNIEMLPAQCATTNQSVIQPDGWTSQGKILFTFFFVWIY